jgi:hypothetical protein
VRLLIDQHRIRTGPLAAAVILSGLCLLAPAFSEQRTLPRRGHDDSAAVVTVAAGQGQVSWLHARSEGGERRTP